MHVCIGAGIVGLATAYALQQAGTVHGRSRGPARPAGASGGNGAQLSYSRAAAGRSRHLEDAAQLLLEKDSPLAFRLRADPGNGPGDCAFWAPAMPGLGRHAALLRLAAESRRPSSACRRARPWSCDHTPGKLVLYPTQQALDARRGRWPCRPRLAGQPAGGGCRRSAPGARAGRLRGPHGRRHHTPSESAADCRQLCEQLARCWRARRRPALRHRGAGLRAQGDAITGLRTAARPLRPTTTCWPAAGKGRARAPAGPAHSRLPAQGLQHHRGRRGRPHTGPRSA
jgi:D-amino-acid dehydrogenase